MGSTTAWVNMVSVVTGRRLQIMIQLDTLDTDYIVFTFDTVLANKLIHHL